MKPNTPAADLAILATMFAGGDKSPAEQQNASVKLRLLAQKVDALQRFRDEVVANAQESELQQAKPQPQRFDVEGDISDSAAFTARVRASVQAFLGAVNEQPCDHELFAEMTAAWIMAEVVSHTGDPQRAVRLLMLHITPLMLARGITKLHFDVPSPMPAVRH